MSENTAYLALYRKYRPLTFEDVRGRDTIVRTLKNQINSGRTSHSYLFCGTRGTGKTTIAKIFAKAVNCEHPKDGSPCGECPMCRAIADDASFNVVEMDAASNNGVDDIRSIIDEVSYSPSTGSKRVYIIDEVHMLSNNAFNALLKTLEEPPEYAIFILCTTEPNKLPVTILSRCQRYDFGRLSVETIEGRLREVADMEHLAADDKALHYIAGAADGSMRDGLSLLDQCNAFNYGNDCLTYEKTLEILGAVDTAVFSDFYRCVIRGDAAGALEILDRILHQGRELMQFVSDYIWYVRGIMLLKASEDTARDLDASKEMVTRMLEDARGSEMNEIIRTIRVMSELMEQIRYSANRRVLTEAAVIRLCRPQMETDIDSILARVRQMESLMAERDKKIASLESALRNPNILAAMPTGGDGVGSIGSIGGAAAAAEALGGDGNAAAGGRGAAAPRRKPVLTRAIPEEVREVAANWEKLLGAMPASYTKAYLKTAKISTDDSGKLLIVFDNYVAAETFTNPAHEKTRAWVRDFLISRTGKEIPIEYKYLDNGEKFTDNYVDLTGIVTMPIDVDDSL